LIGVKLGAVIRNTSKPKVCPEGIIAVIGQHLGFSLVIDQNLVVSIVMREN